MGQVTHGDVDDDGSLGRWQRRRGSNGSRWLKVILVILLLPLLLGAAVAAVAGRPLAFEVVRRLTVRKFPDVKWIDRADLAHWREDPGRPQPVVLDARTGQEYAVSHLKDAIRIDPYRPLLRPLRGFPKDTAIVVYASVGYRSARVAHWLAQQGYSNVQNLAGSIFQWANEGRPVFSQGRPTEEVHPYDKRWGLLLQSQYRADVPPLEKRSAAP
jgi:rhodanese-related sulfurtransferase